MIKVDLITGFLGSGKTTFIKKYAKYCVDQGEKVGILENDYGAVNVDMLLLQELRSENCELEMVAGGCGEDCHRRRFKTKLISMGMSGYDRVIIEPSGIFDMDEFFDSLHEEPLDRWYQIGSVITILDAKLDPDFTEEAKYILTSQLSNAGCILLSKLDTCSSKDLEETFAFLSETSQKLASRRPLNQIALAKSWDDLTEEDLKAIANCGYQSSAYVKKLKVTDAGYETLYFLEHGLREQELRKRAAQVFSDEACGRVLRIKGFFQDQEGGWHEMNATRGQMLVDSVKAGQDVIIVIGYQLKEERIRQIIGDSLQ